LLNPHVEKNGNTVPPLFPQVNFELYICICYPWWRQMEDFILALHVGCRMNGRMGTLSDILMQNMY